jgi:hypothetical protein
MDGETIEGPMTATKPTKRIVHSTWNEELNDKFPQVLEYRSAWKQLGYDVQITNNADIRSDVVRLQEEQNEDDFLGVFDSLETENMQYDFWRYTKLYLEGGVYSDVDVEPHEEMPQWELKATEKNSVVVFEESPTWVGNCTICKAFRPLVSNFPEFPAYASCVIISPGKRAPFFLDILRQVDPEQWQDTREPRKTLMTAGPGLLTVFAKTRDDVLVGTRNDGKQAYTHRGFGTWKPKSTLAFEKYGALFVLVTGFALFYAMKQRTRQRLKSMLLSSDEESQPLKPVVSEGNVSLVRRSNSRKHGSNNPFERNV